MPPWALFGVALAIAVAAAMVWLVTQPTPLLAPVAGDGAVVRATPELVVPEVGERTLDPYRGLGTWVDGFDFSPPYTGPNPPVTPASVQEMVDVGVRTIYIQAARLSERSPDVLEDRWLLASFLQQAHARGVAIVAWYLPKWGDDSADIDRLMAMSEFSVLGHQFDGVAVDIEWTADDLEPVERSRRFTELSAELRRRVGDDPLGAIVLPPVLTDVVNLDFWPEFPWAEIAPLYDVWLPMSYWSFRSESSGYDDGYTYNTESTERLRAHLGDPDAVVHAIGGIGGVDGIDDPVDPAEPLARFDQFGEFARSVVDTGAIGGSVYDWVTLDEPTRALLAELFADIG